MLSTRKLTKEASRVLFTASRASVGASQTGLLIAAHKPGTGFQVEAVEVFAGAVSGTVSVDVQIGTTSVLAAAITPTAGSRVEGTLSSTLANRRGTASAEIGVLVTTAATSSLSDAVVVVRYRVYPAAEDVR